MSGTLYGIGVGPGDPDLLTLKAARCLAQLTVIAFPASHSGESMALSIARPHLRADALHLPLPLTFDPAQRDDDAYDRGAETLAAYLEKGRDVAMLCLGDPFLFGSFLYLFARLAARFSIEVIPGITSISACAALAGMPLAARDDALLMVPATRTEQDLENLLAGCEGAVILKIGRHLGKVRRVLDRLGLTGQAVCIERGGLSGQRIVPFDQLDTDSISYFSMILLHKRGRTWSISP